MGWKMVRDNNEVICRELGVSGSWRVASPEEAIKALGRKLIEEASEFNEANDPRELWDLQDALDELLHLLDPDCQVGLAHTAKTRRQGWFTKHIMWSPVPNDQTR